MTTHTYIAATHEVVERATMKEPEMIIKPQPYNEHTVFGRYTCPYCGRHSSTALSDMKHDCVYSRYQQHIASLRRYPCAPECKWNDGQELEEGKDFELKIEKDNGCPECGCMEYIQENLVGKGYRMCKDCGQEWWTDIQYHIHKNKAAYPLTKEESQDELCAYIETLKAAMQNAIDKQSENNMKIYFHGQETAYQYAIAMAKQHFSIQRIK